MAEKPQPLTAEEQEQLVAAARATLSAASRYERGTVAWMTDRLRWHATVLELQARVTLLAGQLQAHPYDVKDMAARVAELEATEHAANYWSCIWERVKQLLRAEEARADMWRDRSWEQVPDDAEGEGG